MEQQAALEVRHVSKRFPGVIANDDVCLRLMSGEIHALLGENGAGKSTLMNILYGLQRPDAGEILINDHVVTIASPADAIRQGLGMVHQEYALVDTLSVAENIMLGTEIARGGWVSRKEAHRQIGALSQSYGLAVPPDELVGSLPVGVQQRVEILKALYRRARILILDEPTAVLTPQEAEDLFRVMRSLAHDGHSIIFISHKLKEVLAVADTITVLRRGAVVGTVRPAEASERSLAAMMVGRNVELQVQKGPAVPGEVVLDIQDLLVHDDRGQIAVEQLTLQLRAGEILGIAGVQGNGQTELVEAINGLRPVDGGAVHFMGALLPENPRAITEQGVAYIPEDRKATGLVLSYPVVDNLVLSSYYRSPFAHGMVIDDGEMAKHAQKLVQAFDVRVPSVWTEAGTLSGGNQQKVIVAREFSRPIKLLVASQPTRGIDVGSIEFIHRMIVAQRDQGVAVLLVSAELDEILALSDRIAVMFQGRIVGMMPTDQATREQLGLLMAGSREEQAAVQPTA
ncbi:MAG: ABC transporter ATP-binding protein [Herpetosiphon sp.]